MWYRQRVAHGKKSWIFDKKRKASLLVEWENSYMREDPDTSHVQPILQTRADAEEKNTRPGATRIFNRQEGQVPLSAKDGVGQPEVIPFRGPIWYRHWGLNE